MDHNKFLMLKNWLKQAGSVSFFVESGCLGRPGDNQYDFVSAAYENGLAVFSFSTGLKIEIQNPRHVNIEHGFVELDEIDFFSVCWQGKVNRFCSGFMRIEG